MRQESKQPRGGGFPPHTCGNAGQERPAPTKEELERRAEEEKVAPRESDRMASPPEGQKTQRR